MRTRHLITGLAGLVMGVALAGCEITKTVYESPPDTTPPAVPRGVTSITGDREVTILWFESSEWDLAGYGVYRSNSVDGAYTRIAEVTGGGSFVDRNVTNGVTYYYAVDAFDDAGNESDLSPEDVFDTPRPAGYDVLLFARASEPSLAGFDFSRGRRVAAGSADADIEISYDVSNGALFVDAANVDVDIQDFGYTKDLDDLDWAPDNGWSKVGWCELIAGHSYAVWTADDHYAKFRVTSKNGMSVLVDWAYQVAVANPELKPVVLRDSAGTYPAKH
jgi:hypothetical protein